MGCLSSSTADTAQHQRALDSTPEVQPDPRSQAADKVITSNMNQHARADKARKLLLLGTGSSGKSTLFKSLKIINDDKSMENEHTESKHVIRQNCVAGILTLLKKSQELYEADTERNSQCLVSMEQDIVAAIQLVVDHGSESFSENLDYASVEKLGQAIHVLWSLDAVRATFNKRGNTYSFPDNMDYFFNKVREIMNASYVPSTQDSLKCRVRTTGMIEYKYEVKDNDFILYDVGGQRNERKKWIHHFADVTAVLFVCALNHYNAVLFEDEKKNALHEAIELFNEISNSKWFRKSEMILFLNKDDLFQAKLKQEIPLSTCFSSDVGWSGVQWGGPDYKAIPNDEASDREYYNECYQAAIEFIREAFLSVNLSQNRRVYAHVTCATDQDTVQKVFWDVQSISISSSLRKGGLLMY